MVKAVGITKNYGDLQVLKGIDLSISQGEIVSIIGKSGTGKSTLLHILGTLDLPDTGQVIIDGVDITTLSTKQLAALRNEKLGFIFQFHHLLVEFTALENVCIPGLVGGTPKQAVEQKAKELLDYLGLADRMTHRPSELSGGEQQRVAVARALINDPKVIFADEPTGNLDTSTSTELHQLIKKLQKDLQQTFVIVTHNDTLSKLSDRTLTMSDGMIVSPR
jgi:lipoprotein-releasing system ATP-binding protein